jgi:hypothetical protein
MPRDGAITFGDIAGKLDVLNVECEKCGRRGRYHVHRLVERHGIDVVRLVGRGRPFGCPAERVANPTSRRRYPYYTKRADHERVCTL